LIQSPITKVLSSMKRNGVYCLLMGGQACVFYGAAEFSRDIDLAILCDFANLDAIRQVLGELDAECIAVPPFEKRYLDRGHAVHFRCRAPGVERLRIDMMASMRGVDDFPKLWDRRTSIQLDDLEVDLMSLPDLVRAKRTQTDRDWPMTARLLESHYFQNKTCATSEMVHFWLAEIHDRELLEEISDAFPSQAREASRQRFALHELLAGNRERADELLQEEIKREKRLDREYWEPLRQELSDLRKRNRGEQP
jgi:hypothetical protein